MRVVKQVIKVRVLATTDEAAALGQTLHGCNAAATWLSHQMHAARVLQDRCPASLVRRVAGAVGLASQPTIRVIGKVADAYTTLRANLRAGNYGPPGSDRRRVVQDSPIAFRVDAAQPFDARCLSWRLPDELGREAVVSIWTIAGPVEGRAVLADHQTTIGADTRPIGERI